MTTIGITGHASLSDSTIDLVSGAIRDVLRPYANDELIGLTCLARGADQIFAQAVLDLGGMIEVVIPALDYTARIPDVGSRARFDRFMANARAIHEMPFAVSGPEAYFAASKELIHRSEPVIAVWDGSPADGNGGTADAVDYARNQNREIIVVWPPNARRT